MTIDDAFAQAVEHHQAGRLDDAAKLYLRVLAEEPDDPDALQWMGDIALRQGQYTQAVAYLQKSIASDPDSLLAHHGLRLALMQLKRWPEAMGAYETEAALAPGNDEVQTGLVRFIADLALHHGALQKKLELKGIIEHVRPISLKTVVEIGTRAGGTLLMWTLLAARDAMIVSVDLPFGPFGGGDFTDELNKVLTFRRAEQQVEFIRGDSHAMQTKDDLTKVLQQRPVDLMFIDGDHTYEGVKQDYEMYSPLVRPGGLVVFHDILPHPSVPSCQVHRFWDEVKEGREASTFVDIEDDIGYGPWGGIGLIVAR